MMKKHLLSCLLILMACMTFTSCIGDEPANAECDIEKAWVHLDNPTSIFYLRADTLAEILSDYASSDILFPLVRYNAVVGQIPLFVETTPGSIIYQIVNGREERFINGSLVDFSNDQAQRFRVHSEDGKHMREYTIRIKHDKEPAISTETIDLGILSINGITLSGNDFSYNGLMNISPYGEIPVQVAGTRVGETLTFTVTVETSTDQSVQVTYNNGVYQGTWNGKELLSKQQLATLEDTGSGTATLNLGEFVFQTATLIHFNYEKAALDAKTNTYYEWEEEDPLCEPDIWATGNPGFQLSMSSATWDMYPSISEGGGVDGGKCVKLTTRSTGEFGKMVNMRIAAGNLFLGKFDVGNAMKNALKATLMGLPFSHKPLYMRGYYKFQPGAVKQDKNGHQMSEEDVCDFYCVVYKNTDANGNKVQLDGNILDTDPAQNPYKDNIVGIARIKSEDIIRNSDEWTAFELPIAYNSDIKQEDMFNRQYSVAVVFSSSIDGAYFRGAVGSTLWIDNVTLVCEY